MNYWGSVRNKTALLLVVFALAACVEQSAELPVLGPYYITDKVEEGKLVTDTVYGQVRPFEFVDQDGNTVNEQTVDGKVYVTDFFFTSCPTICPKMKQQMLRVYEAFENEPGLLLLSHSIDPKRDSVARLKSFAEKLGVESGRWHLMTGEKDSIYSMARHYMVAAQEDNLAPGGYAHSGQFLLIDQNRQIRGIYDGTLPEEVDVMMEDIRTLLNENEQPKHE